MSRRTAAAGALLVAVAALALPALAKVAPGPAIEMLPPAAPPRAGQLHEGTLRIVADEYVTVHDFTVEGPGWSGLTWDRNAVAPVLAPGQIVLVPFSGVPRDDAGPLRVVLATERCTVRRTFVLDGRAQERLRAPQATRQADFPVPTPRRDPWAAARPAQPKRPEGATPPAEKAPQGYGIRVHGRFIYLRDGSAIRGADGMTVHVYDDNFVIDDLLGSGATDPWGYFDFVVWWDDLLGEEYPDLRVEFWAENTEVEVKTWWMIEPYRFSSGPWNNFTGTDLDVGVTLPGDEDMQVIPHLVTNYTRFWRYMEGSGHGVRDIRVHYPTSEEDGAFYSPATEIISLPSSNAWSSGTQAHEYGHHIMHCLTDMPEIDYCNDVCDEPGDCGHCRWCREDHPVDWTEGWAHYTGDVIPRTFDAVYGTPAINARWMEELTICDRLSEWHDPSGLAADEGNEGFVGAVIRDVADAGAEDDARTPGFDDRLDLGEQAILDLFAAGNPQSVRGFLQDVADAYPDRREDLWWTAMNNGYDLDEGLPDVVYPIVCTSGHTPGVPSANPNLRFYWQRPDDDYSGVRGYSVILSAYGPEMPDPVMDLDGIQTMEYDALGATSWWFSIRTVDWAGHWSDIYNSAGPFIITEPEPRDLAFELQPGWDFYVVPRQAADATPTSCPVPPTLSGTTPTYWNSAARNEGDGAAGAHVVAALWIDGVERDRYDWGDLPGWALFLDLNRGPLTVRGGLHTMSAVLDPEWLIDEIDESNNRVGFQYAWRPPTAVPDAVYYSADPPPPVAGGWRTVLQPFVFYNSFGVAFTPSGAWDACVAWSDDPLADYDLRLHDRDESATGGLRLVRESSRQPGGWLDAVLVNGRSTAATGWDAGVVAPTGGSASFKYGHVTSQAVAFGDSLAEVMGANEYLLLREFEMDWIYLGGVTLDLWTDPPRADVILAWCGPDFTTDALLDADALALTGPDGHARLNVDIPTEDFSCLVIARQPKDGDDDLQVSYRIAPALPDLTPTTPAAWFAPVVPRPDQYATPEAVNAPTVLEGEYEQTWYSFALENASPGMALGAMRFYVGLDGGLGPLNYFHVFDIPGGETRTFVNQGPYTVRGGRHTVVLNLDGLDYMEELDEDNNTYGRQYAWSPAWIDFYSSLTRPAPPPPTGGWEHVREGFPVYFNCDGLRPAFTSSQWGGVAVMPGASSDVDVRLHNVYAGAVNAFGSYLVRSSWGVGESDYVVINYSLADPMPYDAGVLRIAGDEDYNADAPMETWVSQVPVDYGPVTMPAGRILDLYQVNLAAGVWHARLENLAGDVDWGLTLHVNDKPFMNKNDVFADAAAWFAGPGEDEVVTFTITDPGYYVIAAWKTAAAELAKEGQYVLHVGAGAPSGAGGGTGVPAATTLAGIYPNPFNPQTTVEFDLDRPCAVDLAVYDLTGRRVARLEGGDLPAGRHRRLWAGLDDHGRTVASGVYFVRLRAGGVEDLGKVMLLK